MIVCDVCAWTISVSSAELGEARTVSTGTLQDAATNVSVREGASASVSVTMKQR